MRCLRRGIRAPAENVRSRSTNLPALRGKDRAPQGDGPRVPSGRQRLVRDRLQVRQGKEAQPGRQGGTGFGRGGQEDRWQGRRRGQDHGRRREDVRRDRQCAIPTCRQGSRRLIRAGTISASVRSEDCAETGRPTAGKGSVMRSATGFLAAFALAAASAAGAQVTYGNGYPGRPGQPANPNDIVSCGSPQHRMLRCPVPRHWRGAQLVRQTSKAACVQGRTWGFDRGSIWVDKGCGGTFAPANGGGWQPGPGWNRRFEVSCGSPQYKYYFCQVDVGARGRVALLRQNSKASCVQGRTWGWNRAGIWVDKGCGAQFVVDRRW